MMTLMSLSGAAWFFLAETHHLCCCSCFSVSRWRYDLNGLWHRRSQCVVPSMTKL
ncbi:hypothetical protein AtEden1_Chr1g0078161 [Arabidopsis thaliana]